MTSITIQLPDNLVEDFQTAIDEPELERYDTIENVLALIVKKAHMDIFTSNEENGQINVQLKLSQATYEKIQNVSNIFALSKEQMVSDILLFGLSVLE